MVVHTLPTLGGHYTGHPAADGSPQAHRQPPESDAAPPLCITFLSLGSFSVGSYGHAMSCAVLVASTTTWEALPEIAISFVHTHYYFISRQCRVKYMAAVGSTR